jgi:hypothetical protein
MSPTALDFGQVAVGQAKLLSSVLSNLGTSELIPGLVSFAGANAADFSVEISLPSVIQPGRSAPVAIQFVPSATGSRAATLVLATNSDQSPTVEVALSGSGVETPAALVFSPSPLIFANVPAGQFASATVTATNDSLGAITVGSLSLLDPASAFQLTDQPPQLPLTLGPDAGFDFTVGYTASGADGGDRDQITATLLDPDGGADLLTAQEQLSGD